MRCMLFRGTVSSEPVAIIGRTRFATSYTVERITLAGLPAWLRISLTKPKGLTDLLPGNEGVSWHGN